MALPSTGAISMSQVRTELDRTGAISLNDGTVRSLAGKASGIISMADLRGKSASLTVTPGTVKITTSNFRGYSRGHDGLGSGPSAATGSISATVWQGIAITAIGVYSGTSSTFYIWTASMDQPSWSKVTVNGTTYNLTWEKEKLAYRCKATISNAYASLISAYTVSFS